MNYDNLFVIYERFNSSLKEPIEDFVLGYNFACERLEFYKEFFPGYNICLSTFRNYIFTHAACSHLGKCLVKDFASCGNCEWFHENDSDYPDNCEYPDCPPCLEELNYANK